MTIVLYKAAILVAQSQPLNSLSRHSAIEVYDINVTVPCTATEPCLPELAGLQYPGTATLVRTLLCLGKQWSLLEWHKSFILLNGGSRTLDKLLIKMARNFFRVLFHSASRCAFRVRLTPCPPMRAPMSAVSPAILCGHWGLHGGSGLGRTLNAPWKSSPRL